MFILPKPYIIRILSPMESRKKPLKRKIAYDGTMGTRSAKLVDLRTWVQIIYNTHLRILCRRQAENVRIAAQIRQIETRDGDGDDARRRRSKRSTPRARRVGKTRDADADAFACAEYAR